MTKTIPKKVKWKKSKCLFAEALESLERREVKGRDKEKDALN